MRKNTIFIIVTILILGLLMIPTVRTFLRDTFFPIAAIEKATKLETKDLDIDLKGINVPDTNLKNLQQKDLLFLNFWGTWCPPCRQEWPSIEALYNGKKERVDFALIAMQDKEEDVRKFIAENQYTAPVYIAQSPISGEILPNTFPTTFIIYKDGRIVMKESGMRNWNSQSNLTFIENLLNAK